MMAISKFKQRDHRPENPPGDVIEHPPVHWWKFRPSPIIGVDEVGRGCLAGPVFAAAVILPKGFSCEAITDSKLLSAPRREELAKQIHTEALVGIGIASVVEIDRINILQASFLAMRRAIEKLCALSPVTCPETPGHVLVDGHMRIPALSGYKQTALIKGDLRAHPIGAASIVAKVARDQFMRELEGQYSVYGFGSHKGYACPVHVAAIQAHGPCIQHRSTFAGVREHWSERLEQERALAAL